MNYPETLEYLYLHLPMFNRLGASAIKKDLTNTLEICKRLQNPERKFRTIHVAGTNGKGSTSHMLAAILQTAGYKTGLYTSPHLKDFRERIRINGKMIPKRTVVSFVKEQQQNIEEIQPSFFEVTVAMAFDHFAANHVDIAVIETGLGGRLDSTNVITPVLSVITNIGYDHMNILGNSLNEIASEKAGIIKPGIPVIIGEKQREVEDVFIRKAKECRSELHFASDEWEVKWGSGEVGESGSQTSDLRPQTSDLRPQTSDLRPHTSNLKPQTSNLISLKVNNSLDIQLDLTGAYQLKNLATVLSAVEQLRKLSLTITGEHVKTALRSVKKLTGLMGRWQILSNSPHVICDTGHNEDGIREVLKNLVLTGYSKLHFVIGMLKDKDVSKVLALLPKDATYYFCQPDLERARPSRELMQEGEKFSLKGNYYSTVQEAFTAAKANCKAGELVFVGGSTYVVAEVL